LVPEIISFEEKLKRRCLDTTITSTKKYNNVIMYFNCILTTILILRNVTFNINNNNNNFNHM
jgi:hypothetical protein